MKKISILHITFDMGIAGTEQVIYNLTTNLDPASFHNSLFCIEEPIGAIGEKLRKMGFSVYSHNRRAGFDTKLITSIRKIIKEEKIDIVHCHQYSPYVYGLLASIGLGKKVVFTEHGRLYPDLPSKKRRLLNPIFERITDAIVSISKATAIALEEVENFSRSNIQVIYNGVTAVSIDSGTGFDIRERFGIPTDAVVFGTVSRLDPIKNQQLMLKAFAKVNARVTNSYLVFVGDGPEKSALERLAITLSIRKNTIFAGFQIQPSAYFNAMDVFLLTSHTEGASMTLLEAMSCKLPCIVTAVGGNMEIISDRETGILIEANNEDALAEEMLVLSSDTLKRSSLGESAQQKFHEAFSVQNMIYNYIRLYDSLLGMRPNVDK